MMNIAKKSINKVCAILIIIALTISDFFIVGSAAVTYAVDTIKTNSSNVNFSAYFIDENGDKVEEIGANIDEEEVYLYIDVSVYNEGYFNGSISLENSNFNIKNEILGDEIAEISGNTVTLNQINAGSTKTIKLAIEPVIEDTISRNNLTCDTDIAISGEYVNSKNVEKNKYVEIKGTATVSLTWASSEESDVELESSLLTNSIYTINNEEKRIVQVLVNSRITDNNYPAYNTKITLSTPENVEEVSVLARSTDATNVNTEFSTENYVYSSENNTLEIQVENSDTNSISWSKDSYDTFVVTYVFNVSEYISENSINVTDEIITYDSKTLTKSQDVAIQETENIDGVISYSVEPADTSIYKGRLYTGEEKEYTITNSINVNYLNIVDGIVLKGNEATYVAGEQQGSANIVYTQTKINKDEFIKIFGEDGYLTIKDSDGNTVANITNSSEADENGYITVNYFNNVKNIEISTSAPKNLGTLNIEHTKTILNTGYTRETITSLSKIKETITGTDNGTEVSEQAEIELKNTSSEAELNISTDTLSTSETNENVKITAILLNNDESKDLYQNPVIKITLPEQVTSLSAKCKLLYGNGLELSNAEIKQENGQYVIEIALSGTQTSYNTEILEGTTIIIYADMEIDKLAADSEEEITLTYTNEIATSFKDEGKQTAKINITSSQGVITANTIEEYDIEEIGDQGTKTLILETEAEEKTATVSIDAVNNEGTSISNVAILGSFPTGDDSNLGISLTSGINLSTGSDGISVYYSDESNPTTDLTDSSNGWTKTGNASTAQSYLIVADELAVGETVSASYGISIPAGLEYDQEAEEGYTVTYTNNLTSSQKAVSATTVGLSTGTGADIESTLKAYVGGEEISDGNTIYTGEVVTYEVTLENKGTEDATNVEVQATIPENGTCVSYVKSTETSDTETEMVGSEDYFQTIETTDNVYSKTYETLATGEKKTITYDVKLEDSSANSTISSYVTTNYNATTNNTTKTTSTTNTISNAVSQSEIEMSMVMSCRGENTLEAGISYAYYLTVKNTTERNLSNIKIDVNTNELYTIERVISNVTGENVDMTDNSFTISSLSSNSSITYEIDVMLEDEGNPTIVAIANETYKSNMVKEEAQKENANVAMSSETEGEKVVAGDFIIYKIEVTNNGNEDIDYFSVSQEISTYLEVQSVTINNEEVEFEANYDEEYRTEDGVTVEVDADENEDVVEEEEPEDSSEEEDDDDDDEEEGTGTSIYSINYDYENVLSSGETATILISTYAEVEDTHDDDINIVSKAEITTRMLKLSTEEISHILGANIQESNGEEVEGEDLQSDAGTKQLVDLDYTVGGEDETQSDNEENNEQNNNEVEENNEITTGEVASNNETSNEQNSDEVNTNNEQTNNEVNTNNEQTNNEVNTNNEQTNNEVDTNNIQNDNNEDNNNVSSLNENTSNTSNSNNNSNTGSVESSEEEVATYVVSGTAWLDEDEDGERESGEETLSGIEVILLNLADGSQISTTTTDSGFYSFTEVTNGEYVIIVNYDTDTYALTTYKADGVSENRNSDVENVNMTISGTTEYVTASDTITINGNSSTNIDIGFIEAKIFDLSLTKTITKISITNSAGTETTEYDDTTLAKAEIKAKYLSGSTVVIEYKVKVTNEGELPGYVSTIVDYKPTDLSFNSSLNSDWYQSGEYLYSTALANEKLEAGETKELTLVLTKTMTETNTGLVNNMAEISEHYNSRGTEDTDSTPGNKDVQEDDLGQANAIISVSTGAAVSYISITAVIVLIIAAGVIIITRKVLKADTNYWTERRGR